MTLVFLLEEKSMKYFLDDFLPTILPEEVTFITIPHEGKSDLKKSIPRKLKGWNIPDTKFVIVHDQDSNNCMALKQELRNLCMPYQKAILIRIACHELEAWYWGDIEALEQAYGKDLSRLKHKNVYRIPDNIVSPKRELQKYIPEHQQIAGARAMARHIDIKRNNSRSFHVFIDGVLKLCGEASDT